MKSILKVCSLLLFFYLTSCTTSEGEFVGGSSVGALEIKGASGNSRVFLDGRLVSEFSGESIIIPSLAKGKYNITLASEYHDLSRTTVDIIEGEIVTLDFSLTKVKSGNLTISLGQSDEYLGTSISLDGLNYGQIVDDEFEINGLPLGEYVLSFNLGSAFDTKFIIITDNSDLTENVSLNFENSYLVEHITNVSCNGCPEKGEILMHILDSLKFKSISKITYNADWPSNKDPFNLPFAKQVEERVDLYASFALPVFIVNGEVVQYKNNEDLARLLKEKLSVFDASSDYGIFSRNINDKRELCIINNSNTDRDVLARVSLIEDRIELSQAPGTNGEKIFHQVFRGNQLDTVVNLKANETLFLDFDIDVKDYTLTQLKLVSFIQDVETNEILQASNSEI